MNGLSKDSATSLEVGEEGDGQRVDNYLTRLLKGVPKSHIYRILRSGEVRVNSGRVSPEQRLRIGDKIRVPPIRISATRKLGDGAASVRRLSFPVLFEDDALLVIDKPAGVAVHGGSGVSMGVIEALRHQRPELKFLELVHRLDRETSGVLMLAKKRSALTALHEQMREGRTKKLYLALAKGEYPDGVRHVREPLQKYTLASGERRVRVSEAGQPAHTVFRLQQRYGRRWSLVEADLKTGRTHQIRVHLAHSEHAIAGDDKYGDFDEVKTLQKQGLPRMFLHAARLEATHPRTGQDLEIEAPLPADLQTYLDQLEAQARPDAAQRRPERVQVRPVRAQERPDRSPSRSDRSPSRSDRSPSRSDRSPSRSDRSPSRSDRSPARSDRSPSRSDRSPARSDRSPARSERSPARSERSPARSERSPARSERSPARSERSPARSERSPARSERSPARSERSPARSERGSSRPARSGARSTQPRKTRKR